MHYLSSLFNCLNKFLNCLLSPLWNYLFLINGVHKFGRHEEKMSEVLGWAELYNDLKPMGKRIADYLNKKDPNHCLDAVKWGVTYSQNKLKEYGKVFI